MLHSRLGRSNIAERTIHSNKDTGRRQRTGNDLDEDLHITGFLYARD